MTRSQGPQGQFTALQSQTQMGDEVEAARKDSFIFKKFAKGKTEKEHWGEWERRLIFANRE